MARAVLDEIFNRIVTATADKVKTLGFVRRGALLRVVKDGNAGVIEFQKSSKSSSEVILFTVNLVVICGSLLDPEHGSVEKAKSYDAHLRQRIGMLMAGRPDKWWEIKGNTEAEALSVEVFDLILSEGAPYIMRYLDSDQLAALWKSGKSPGLTETQRVRFLEKLARRPD